MLNRQATAAMVIQITEVVIAELTGMGKSQLRLEFHRNLNYSGDSI